MKSEPNNDRVDAITLTSHTIWSCSAVNGTTAVGEFVKLDMLSSTPKPANPGAQMFKADCFHFFLGIFPHDFSRHDQCTVVELRLQVHTARASLQHAPLGAPRTQL